MAIPLMILADPRNWRAQPAMEYGSGGYQTGGTHKTLSAAVALGAATLMVAGLATALVAPEIIRDQFEPTRARNIPIPPPTPTEPNDPPKAQPRETDILIPRPLDPLPTTSDNAPMAEILPSFDPGPYIIPSAGTGTGSGPSVAPTPPQPPEPVYRGPSINTRYARDFQPSYPLARQREGVEGRCTVRVTIAPSGRVTAVENVACADSAFFEATQRQALRNWRFNPATRDGVAVESTLNQTVVFRINE